MRLPATAELQACNDGLNRNGRNGATLVEVLVAIFVTGIGLLALLVLFPLGALNMAQAIRNDRSAQAALNATSIARMLPHNNNTTSGYGLRDDPLVVAAYTPAPAGGPSRPVFIDPAGVVITGGGTSTGTPLGYLPPQLAGPPGLTGIPRIMPNYLFQVMVGPPPKPVQPLIARYFTLLDDLSFLDNGVPDLSNGTVQRDGRYTWCYMSQKPSVSGLDVNANLTVIVYDRRTVLIDAALAAPQPPQGERSFLAKFDATTNLVTLTWDPAQRQETPAVRRGTWILDATLAPQIHGFFYRVVGTAAPVSAGGTQMQMDIELQSNPKASTDNGVAVVMENVVEVFERGHK
jgi:hypothetical protein